MQIQCVICSDILTVSAVPDIVGLACGHIFHGLCIRTWFDRSATCPQCRAKATPNNQYKIYFTIAPEPEGQDIITLTRSVDNLKYELKLKNMEFSSLTKDLVKYKTRAEGLVKEVRKLEENIVSVNQVTLQLNEQRKFANSKGRELSEAKFLIESLENELKQFKTLKEIVKKATVDLDYVDINSLDTSQLTFLLSTFKKDVTRLSKMNEDLKKALSKSENEKISIVKKNQELQESECLKERVIESLKDTLAKNREKELIQKNNLEEKIDRKNENSESPNSSISMDQSSVFKIPRIKRERDQHINNESTHNNEYKSTPHTTENKIMNILPVPKQAFRITSDRLRGIGQVGTSLKFLPNSDVCGGMGNHSRENVFSSGYRPRPGLAKARKLL